MEMPAGQSPSKPRKNPDAQASSKKWTRRRVLKYVAGSVAGLIVGGGSYTLLEASWLKTSRAKITLPGLPPSWRGRTVAFMSDLHHGPYTGRDYLAGAVARINAANPELILLGGDYVHRESRFIEPCFEVLADLKAPRGVFAVLGNHDHWHGAQATRDAMARAGVVDLTNRGVRVTCQGAPLHVGGVGDLWEDTQDPATALAGAVPGQGSLLLSHNPDYVETLADPRVGLVLSGHTHGGQVRLPFLGAPILPSRYGQKYAEGLVQGPAAQVFVSRGVGTITPPVRFGCRPEVNLFELA